MKVVMHHIHRCKIQVAALMAVVYVFDVVVVVVPVVLVVVSVMHTMVVATMVIVDVGVRVHADPVCHWSPGPCDILVL